MVPLLFYLFLAFYACFLFTIVHCLSFDKCVCVLVYSVSVRVFVVCARFAIDSQQPPEPPVFVYSLLLPFPGPELLPFPRHPLLSSGMRQHECCMHNKRIDVKLKNRTHNSSTCAGVGALMNGAQRYQELGFIYCNIQVVTNVAKQKEIPCTLAKKNMFPVFGNIFKRKFFVEIRFYFFYTEVEVRILKL